MCGIGPSLTVLLIMSINARLVEPCQNHSISLCLWRPLRPDMASKLLSGEQGLLSSISIECSCQLIMGALVLYLDEDLFTSIVSYRFWQAWHHY